MCSVIFFVYNKPIGACERLTSHIKQGTVCLSPALFLSVKLSNMLPLSTAIVSFIISISIDLLMSVHLILQDKNAFADILKKISKIQKTNGHNYVVLREDKK